MWNGMEAPAGGLSKALQVSSCLQFFLPHVSASFPFQRGQWQSLSICACLKWSSTWIKSEMSWEHLAVDVLTRWLLGSERVHCFSSPSCKFNLAKIPVHENSQGKNFNVFLLLIIYSLSMTHQTSDLQRCGCVVCACLGTAARHERLNQSSKRGKCVWTGCLLFLK